MEVVREGEEGAWAGEAGVGHVSCGLGGGG